MIKKILKGLSWGEIAVSLLIFVLIAALALPSFSRFKCLAKQSEAKFEIPRVVAAAQLYKEEFQRLPTVDELVASERIKIRQKYYSYELTQTDGGRIIVVATGRSDIGMQADKWWGDSHKKLENIQNACAK